jgi:hypothetical protein
MVSRVTKEGIMAPENSLTLAMDASQLPVVPVRAMKKEHCARDVLYACVDSES